jgi:glycosyltransferase involved in cell wall biosynthesis
VKLAYFLQTDGACDYYRLDLPISTMKRCDPSQQVLRVRRHEFIGKSQEMLYADVMVAGRPGLPSQIPFFRRLKEAGVKVVVDYDDNMFEVSPLSDHYVNHGTENIIVRSRDGAEIPLWVDPTTVDKMPPGAIPLDIARNKENLEAVRTALREADLVTTTNDILAGVFRAYNKNVAVLPNCVDLSLWQKLPLQETDQIRLTWFGGSSHFEDLEILETVLPEIMGKYPQTVFVMMGQNFPGRLRKLPADRVECHPWCPTEAYPYKARILNPTIGIIPLRETRFNSCKSPIKWVEMGAMEVPCVTSYVQPYSSVATEDNGVFIEKNDLQAWFDGISCLIEDRGLRSAMGRAAYKTVCENFDIETQYPRWAEAYQNLLKVEAK